MNFFCKEQQKNEMFVHEKNETLTSLQFIMFFYIWKFVYDEVDAFLNNNHKEKYKFLTNILLNYDWLISYLVYYTVYSIMVAVSCLTTAFAVLYILYATNQQVHKPVLIRLKDMIVSTSYDSIKCNKKIKVVKQIMYKYYPNLSDIL